MNIGLEEKDLDLIVDVFKAFPTVKKAVVFGSRANGKHKRGSDIDIALYGESIPVNCIKSDLEDLPLPYFFDLVDISTVTNDALIEHINEFGVVVYET